MADDAAPGDPGPSLTALTELLVNAGHPRTDAEMRAALVSLCGAISGLAAAVATLAPNVTAGVERDEFLRLLHHSQNTAKVVALRTYGVDDQG